MGERLFSVGHSTRTPGELLDLLHEADIQTLADVRRVPASRRNPWFARAELAETLTAAQIGYHWLGGSIGGRQPTRLPFDQSPNRAWREETFRNYADAMPTPAFQRGAARLAELARAAPTAMLCAERDWHHCHRQLLADLFTARGFEVIHLIRPAEREPHPLHPDARFDGTTLTYPTLL